MQLKQWRQIAQLSQQDLAHAARVSRASIAHVERGYYPPSPRLASRISGALSECLGYEVRITDIFEKLRPAGPLAQPVQTAAQDLEA
jgi:DNA-binding XRE family transcriptional regulator